MMNFWCIFILVICPLFSPENAIEICANGVFKCISATSLRICFNGQLVSTEFACPNSTYCSETSEKICVVPDYDYTDYLEIPEEKFKPETNPDLKCTEEGMFPIANSSCKKYLKCIKNPSGFVIKQLNCYSGYFDPVSKNCSTSYICPDLPEDCPLDIPKCTAVGNLPIPNTDCKKYAMCKQTINGWEAQVNDCFTAASFNPTIGRCEKKYICTETTKNPESCISTSKAQVTDPTADDSTTTGSPTTDTTNGDSTTTDITTNQSITSEIPTTNPTADDSTTTGSPITDRTTRDSTTTDTTTNKSITPETPITNPTADDSTTTSSPTTDTTNGDSTTTDITTNQSITSEIPTTNPTADDSTTTGSPITDRTTRDSTTTDTTTNKSITPETPTTNPTADDTTITSSPTTDTTNGDSTTTDITTNQSITSKIPTTNPTADDFTTTSSPTTDTTNGDLTTTDVTTNQSITSEITTTNPTADDSTTTGSPITDTTTIDSTTTDTTTKDSTTTDTTTNQSITSETPITHPTVDDFTTTGSPISDSTTGDSTTTDTTTNQSITSEIPITNTAADDSITTGSPTTDTTTRDSTTTDTTTNQSITSEIPITNPTADDSTITDSTTKDSMTDSTTISVPECTKSGRYPIKNSDCKQYLLCIVTSNGFLQQIVECPINSFFDPLTQKCKTYYICEENLFTTTTADITNATTETITTESIITNAPITNPTVDDSTITDSTTKDLITDLTTISVPECTKSGKYPIPNSGCKQYLLCIVTSNGFLQQIVECPINSFFDPDTQRCKTYYICAEKPFTTTTTEISTTTVSEELNTTEKPSTPIQEYSSTSTTESSAHVNCKEQGKFSIVNTNCMKYLHCIATTNGFLEQIIECKIGTKFDPQLQKCSEVYICSEFLSTEEKIDTPIPSNDLCKQQGKFPIENTNCKKYISCTVISHGFETTNFECSDGSFFDSNLQKCSPSYICNELPSNIQNKTNIKNDTECLHERSIIPECLEEGKFPILGVNCKKYILCVQTSTGIKEKEYECPGDTSFDPEKRRCLLEYQCTEKQCQSTPNFEDTTELIPINPEVPTCLLQGKQEISGTNCKKFVLCVQTQQGLVPYEYSCPAGSLFHPIKKRCSGSYICEEDIKTCTTVGRFPDHMDINCKFYYECVEQDINHSVQGIKKKCSDGYYFDPKIQECSTNYICQNNLSKKDIHKNVISPRFLVNGQCTTVGRYLVPFSNCRNYVYCSANTDGTLKATNFVCPTTTVFNQAIQKCASPTTYTCPDSVCLNGPGFISWANPNVRDCTSYITCQPVFDNNGMMLGTSGVVMYCQPGERFNPMIQFCDSTYVCPTNIG